MFNKAICLLLMNCEEKLLISVHLFLQLQWRGKALAQSGILANKHSKKVWEKDRVKSIQVCKDTYWQQLYSNSNELRGEDAASVRTCFYNTFGYRYRYWLLLVPIAASLSLKWSHRERMKTGQSTSVSLLSPAETSLFLSLDVIKEGGGGSCWSEHLVETVSVVLKGCLNLCSAQLWKVY